MDVYRIGVSILATNSMTPVLNTIGRQMIGLQGTANAVGGAIGGWKSALGVVAGVLAAGAIAKGFLEIAEAGGKVNHQIELMKTAGMTAADTQASIAKAMQTSGEVMTTTISENLQHLRELRYAFGETTTAVDHLSEISKANAILSNIKGGGKDQVWELVKALESKGETYDPKEFSSYVDTMTKVVQATGGKVTPQMFMGTFKYGRTSTLGWSEDFIGGALPRLIQEYTAGGSGSGGSGGPGNALMSMYAKIVQEQMSKTAAAEFERMGLGQASNIKGSAQARLTGMPGRDLFMANPYEWVQQVLMPKLAEHGITSKEAVLEQLSKMFQVRTASDITAKMALQGRFMEGAQSPFEKDINLQKQPMGLPAYEELAKHDYPMLLEQFTKQWHNFLEVLGSPLMAPEGTVIKGLAAVTSAMGAMAQAAKPLAEAVGVLGTLASVGVTIGKFLLDISGVTGVFEAFGKIPWASIQSGLDSVRTALEKLLGWISGLAEQLGRIGKFFLSPSTGVPPGMKDGNIHKESFQFDPSRSQPKATPIAFSLNVDGQTLTQAIINKMDQMTEHATGAPSYDGMQRFIPSDGGVMGT